MNRTPRSRTIRNAVSGFGTDPRQQSVAETDLDRPLTDFENVVGIALENENSDDETLVAYVSEKRPASEVSDPVPETVTVDGDSIPTDVRPLGTPSAPPRDDVPEDDRLTDPVPSAQDGPGEESGLDRRTKHRPVVPGVSAGHPRVTMGSLGTALEIERGHEDLADIAAVGNHLSEGDVFFLTNAHVAGPPGASVGDTTYQPGPDDISGDPSRSDVVGYLHNYAPPHPDTLNLTDSALIEPSDSVEWVGDTVDDVPSLGDSLPISGIDRLPPLDATYVNLGARTGMTTGSLEQLNADVRVGLPGGEPGAFTGVDIFDLHIRGGDSGSVIGYIDDDGFVLTHLVFAGSDDHAIGFPLHQVERCHQVRFRVPGSDE